MSVNNRKVPKNIEETDINELMNSNISFQTIPTPIDTIISRMDSGYYIIPEYQRNYIWNEKQIVALIVSLLKNIPIPRLYMYSDPRENGRYAIIDGQQRITSLFFFIKGVYPVSEKNRKTRYDFKEISEIVSNYKVAKTEKEKRIQEKELKEKHSLSFKEFYLNNLKFNLDEIKKAGKELEFNIKTLDFGVVSVQKKAGEFDIYSTYTNIFRLLNSAGISLTSQEIRNGLYYRTELYKEINRINIENKIWLKIKKKENNHHNNVEFLLRILALDNYIKVISKNNLIVFLKNDFKLSEFKLENIEDIINDEILSTYSALIDKFSFEYSKDEEFKRLENQLYRLKCFINGIEGIPNKQTLNLNFEAFFIASSKLGLLNESFKIESETLSKKINSTGRTSTSDKKEIFKRVFQAMEVLIEKDKDDEKL